MIATQLNSGSVTYAANKLPAFASASMYIQSRTHARASTSTSSGSSVPNHDAGGSERRRVRPHFDPRVYLVTDPRVPPGRTVADVVTRALAGYDGLRGITAVQFRDKRPVLHDDATSPAYTTAKERVATARALRDAAWRAGALFFVNDDVDLAREVGADGVHVGQDDMGVEEVRALLRQNDALVGVSAGTPEEAEQAIADGADYVGVGAVFATGTKKDAGAPIGVDGLGAVVAAVRGRVPVVAIGGVDADGARLCRAAGADGVAVVSAIMSAADPGRAATDVLRAWL